MKILLLISLLSASSAFSQTQTQTISTNSSKQPAETQKQEPKTQKLPMAPERYRKSVKPLEKKESTIKTKEQ